MSNTARALSRVGKLIFAASLVVCHAGGALALEFPGPGPGTARGRIDGHRLVLENEALACSWTVADGRLKPERIQDKLSGTTLDLTGSHCFRLLLADSPRPALRHGRAARP